jgi:hypothetical protein
MEKLDCEVSLETVVKLSLDSYMVQLYLAVVSKIPNRRLICAQVKPICKPPTPLFAITT